MTKKDFFTLIIKIFGLYWLLNCLIMVLPQIAVAIQMRFNGIAIAFTIVATSLAAGLFVLLLFKSDKLVDLLKLERGFEEDRIDFGGLKASDIIKISCLIIGGLLLINTIPSFLYQTFLIFRDNVSKEFAPINDEYRYWAESMLKIIVGYLLITNYTFAAKMLKNKEE